MPKDELDSLSNTATNFFHFIQAFSIKLKLRNFINISMTEDRVQDLDSSTCGIFQLFSMKKVKYKAIQDLTKKQLRHYLKKYLL